MAFVRQILIWKVMLQRSLGNTGLQGALDCISCQIVCTIRESGIEQCLGFPNAYLGNILKVDTVQALAPYISSLMETLRAALVGAFAGVDADLFAFVDEGGNLNDEAGLGLGGLADAGGGG